MKHLFILCLSFLISTADAQQAIRFINLTGTAEHIVDADEIVFNIQVRTTAKSLDEAKKKNDEQISNIRKILAELNIKKDDFEIHPISLGKEYEWQNNKRVDKGFFAATNVTFKLKDFSRYYEYARILSYRLRTRNIFIAKRGNHKGNLLRQQVI